MKWFFVGVMLTAAFEVAALSPVSNPAVVPYEVFAIDTPPAEQHEYLGTLDGYPHMYEITSDEPFTLQVELWRDVLINDPNAQIVDEDFALIIVRQNETRGVSEVARWRQTDDGIEVMSDSRLAFDTRRSEPVMLEVGTGTYRIEVSSPNNSGRYALLIGQESPAGFFKTISGIRAIQQHFGYGWFTFLRSSYVFYPLGIAVLLILGYLTWRYRQHLQHVV